MGAFLVVRINRGSGIAAGRVVETAGCTGDVLYFLCKHPYRYSTLKKEEIARRSGQKAMQQVMGQDMERKKN